jgi:hypothetical protein
MKRITSLNQAIDLAVRRQEHRQVDAKLSIEVNGEAWTCYTVSISYRDILCYCDQGTATLLIDSYGDRHVAELFDWETN